MIRLLKTFSLILIFCIFPCFVFAATPTVGTITPVSGVSNPTVPVNFITTYSDPDGWANIQLAQLLISTSASTKTNCFFAYYNQNTNLFYLRNNGNSAWVGGFAPGTANIIENSYAQLDCSKTTISGSGNTLTINWSVTFKSTFTGAKKTYLYVKDDSNAYQGLIQKGTWTINSAPTLGTITPSSGTGSSNTETIFTATYSDANTWQDIQYVHLLVNTTINGTNCFYGYYNQNTNLFYLRNDVNTAWLGGFAPGSANTIENSYVKLNCATSTATGLTNTLTVKWAITFKDTFLGLKNLYLYAKDDRNLTVGWTQKATRTIRAKPQAGTITPNSGSSIPNQQTLFTTTYTDADGYTNTQLAYFLINTSSTAFTNCFYAYYNQNTNKLYLRNNGNSSWVGGFAPGTANIIQNSYCILDCSKVVVLGSGPTLSIIWPITFKSTFLGTKNMYLQVKDDTNISSGWVQKGSWTISTSVQGPTINSIIPADGATFLAGAKINIQVNASSPNPPLQYQYSVGGTVKQAWISSNTYAWQTTTADTSGSISIKCEVKDSKSAISSKTISVAVINPTIQQILQKVSDNYAKVTDLTADMTLSSTLDGAPFGETDYCKYYFKAPNKEKTETYFNASRTTKTDIIIISGTNMYLMNPVSQIKQTVDLLTDAGVNVTQFNQMDLYYNQILFQSQHNITKNDSAADLGIMIITLEAVPKEINNIYDKLSISFDYAKGIITKFIILKKNDAGQILWVQKTETIQTQQMPNGAWISTKMTKAPNLTSGFLISTVVYSNATINSGLTDLVFDPDKQ